MRHARQKNPKHERVRLSLWEAQAGTCPICGLPIARSEFISVDHVLPRKLGGVNVGNRVATHKRCNNGKMHRLPTGCELIWLSAVNRALGLP